MTNIWHTADEIPDFNKSYVELLRSVQGDLVYSTWGHPNYITKNTIKWCYMDDLLALETELERTRKALDVAKKENEDKQAVLNCIVDMLKTLNQRYTLIMGKDVIKETVRLLEQKDVK